MGCTQGHRKLGCPIPIANRAGGRGLESSDTCVMAGFNFIIGALTVVLCMDLLKDDSGKLLSTTTSAVESRRIFIVGKDYIWSRSIFQGR